MSTINRNAPYYLQNIADEPRETYFARHIAPIRQALIDHPEPEDAVHILQQLLIYVSIQDPEERIILAEKLFAMDTKKQYIEDVYIVLARCYAKKNEIKKAVEYYYKGFEIDPTQAEFIIEWAQLYATNLDFDNALDVYKLLDNDEIENGKENSYRYRGTIYYNRQEFDKAMDCYQNALAIYPEDEDGVLTENIGGTYWQQKQYDQAMQWFKKALEKNPKSAQAHYGMGLCYQGTEDYRAMHHYTEALKIKPDFTAVFNNIAFIAVNHDGELKKGIEMLEKAVESAEDKNSLGLVYLNLAKIYGMISDYDKAEYY